MQFDQRTEESKVFPTKHPHLEEFVVSPKNPKEKHILKP